MVVVSMVFSDSSVYDSFCTRTFWASDFHPRNVFDLLYNFPVDLDNGYLRSGLSCFPFRDVFFRIQDIDYREPGAFIRNFYLDDLLDCDYFLSEFIPFLSRLSPDSEEYSMGCDLFVLPKGGDLND